MKKILLSLSVLLIAQFSFSQYFQATVTNAGNVLTFTVNPNSTITTQVSYFEIAFRYDTTVTPTFPLGAFVTNTTNFPGMTVGLKSQYDVGKYRIVDMFYSGTPTTSTTYTAGTPYAVFTLTLGGPANDTATIELASDFTTEPNDPTDYVFAMIAGDGATFLMDPAILNGIGTVTTDPVLYGPGHYTSGTGEFVPLVNGIVPVKFTGFSATKQSDNALLNWDVTNETSSTNSYEVQRSLDGTDFTSIANISVKGTGSTNSYSYTDANISLLKSSGVIYYRIEQVDKNGQVSYTEIKTVKVTTGLTISAYPNPARGVVSVSIFLAEESTLSLTVSDASGKQVRQIQLQGAKGTNINKINLDGLASGSYLLKVNSATEIATLPIIKEQE